MDTLQISESLLDCLSHPSLQKIRYPVTPNAERPQSVSRQIRGAAVNFLIDCGATSLPALKRLGIVREAIDLILITHFHGDHFAGLPFLLLDAQFSRRARPLVIAGPLGVETKLKAAMEVMFEHSSKTQQLFELSVVELKPEETINFGGVTVTPYPVVHGEFGGPLQYSIQRAASSAVPVPAFTQIMGSHPTARQNATNSSVPKKFGSTPPQAGFGRVGRRSAGPIPSSQ